jgi:hypothetical protein
MNYTCVALDSCSATTKAFDRVFGVTGNIHTIVFYRCREHLCKSGTYNVYIGTVPKEWTCYDDTLLKNKDCATDTK